MGSHAGCGRQEVLINDYLDAYYWLRNNTPYDSRVMAWCAAPFIN